MEKTKVEMSISLDEEMLTYIKENYKNRSKFVSYCIKQELLKDNNFQQKINNLYAK